MEFRLVGSESTLLMDTWISCNAPYGVGGLGRHLSELIEWLRASGKLRGYFCSQPKVGDEAIAATVRGTAERFVLDWTPIRFSPGWRNFSACELFDRAAASAKRPDTSSYVAFVGQSLRSFIAARARGTQCLRLVAANSHVSNVRRRHRLALVRYPYEEGWLNRAQELKTLKEYQVADQILVASDYSWNTFLAAGVSEKKLCKFPLTPHPRFRPRQPPRADDGVFRIVYIGSLTVTKGIPVLVEAFERLGGIEAELILVGGWATRGMRRYCQEVVSRNSRIRIVPGDPLPHLSCASVLVHPSFEDGFAYAPAEALACGIPVVVTEDTGMKELVHEGVNGYIVPTGDVEALSGRLEHLSRHPLKFAA